MAVASDFVCWSGGGSDTSLSFILHGFIELRIDVLLHALQGTQLCRSGPVLTDFLIQQLAVCPAGMLEAFSYVVRMFSGVISDRMTSRKAAITAGFVMGAAAKFGMSFATSTVQLFMTKAVDRLGNGVQVRGWAIQRACCIACYMCGCLVSLHADCAGDGYVDRARFRSAWGHCIMCLAMVTAVRTLRCRLRRVTR